MIFLDLDVDVYDLCGPLQGRRFNVLDKNDIIDAQTMTQCML